MVELAHAQNLRGNTDPDLRMNVISLLLNVEVPNFFPKIRGKSKLKKKRNGRNIAMNVEMCYDTTSNLEGI